MTRENTSGLIIDTLEQGVLTIVMNRPDKKNALYSPMYTRMAELIEGAGESSGVRAILVTGTEDCFSSGNDVATFASFDEGSGGPPVRFLSALAHCELPVVAAVNGPAIGVGTTMLLHCDFVIAAEEAVFKTPFVDLGVCPEAGSSFTMPQRLGYGPAARMLLLGEQLDARQALECGLATAVYPAESYQREALALAGRLAQLPPTSVRSTKRLLRAPWLENVDAAMARENKTFADCVASPEFGEAISAFMEKRPADFSKF